MNTNNWEKCVFRIVGMVLVGLSVYSIPRLGWWFLFPWVISWGIYDQNVNYSKEQEVKKACCKDCPNAIQYKHDKEKNIIA